MVSAVLPSSATRSSLEEMLDSIRQRDERPKDVPPALPVRPTSKARLPSARRSLPVNFKIGDAVPEYLPNDSKEKGEKKRDQCFTKEDDELSLKSGGLGSKKMKVETPVESPYIRNSEAENYEQGLEETDDSYLAAAPLTLLPSTEESEWSDNLRFVLKKKLRVWCWLPSGQWESGKVQSTSREDALVLLLDGSVVKVPTGDLLPANPDILEGVDDLIQLSYLNEPSILHNLQHRYSHDMIYSKAGPVLVAINPFKDVQLYGNDFVTAYRKKLTDSPHVYAIADTAFNEMMRDEVNQSIIIRESYLVFSDSGESGAGKTETAKIAMQYLASLGGGSGIECEILQTNCILEAFGNAKTSRNDNSSRFGKLIEIHFSTTGKISGAKIQTFLLEKSRVVQLAKGERSYHIFYQLCAGAPSILKERLNLKMASEYDYLKQSDCLTIDSVDDAQKFHLLMAALDIVQLCKEDQETTFAMLAAVLWLGNISFQVTDNENHVEVVVDEVYTLYGVSVSTTDPDCRITDSMPGLCHPASLYKFVKLQLKLVLDCVTAVNSASRLMGCDVRDLMLALCTRKIRAGNDNIAKKLTLRQAIDTRDALAKSIYANLFDWLVEKINKSLEAGKQRTGRSINILDIYGFESFLKNSFEQFCINYANERLQQHFNRHLLKLEQEEYAKDGIDWTKVDFEDNQECLNLFEKKPLGLLSLLDEESTFPKATDLTFANKLKQHLNSNPCFKEERDGAFSVRHYAAEVSRANCSVSEKIHNLYFEKAQPVDISLEQVLYDASGFLEKNRDPLHSNSIQLLSSCSCELPQLFASNMLNQSRKSVSPSWQLSVSDSQKQSVGTKFKGQLFKLMQRLESTTPHFIRCIKPNSKQLPGMYEKDLVLQQLRCCGVLEVVRISRSGYPTRMTHEQFSRRYGFLLLENIVSQDPLSISVAILQQFNVLPDMYQVGYTKIFFRTGQVSSSLSYLGQDGESKLDADDNKGHFRMDPDGSLNHLVIGVLEGTRKQTLEGILGVQKCFRGHQARCYFRELKRGIITLQSCNAYWYAHAVVRGENARKEYQNLIERWKAVEIIQKHMKQWIAQRTLNDQQRAVILLQSVIRGQLARRHFTYMQNLKKSNLENTKAERETDRKIPEMKVLSRQEHVQVPASVLAELQRRVLKAEAALGQKEEENAALQQQLQQFETRWSQYEAKMKSMEEMWQKQMASLQASLSAAKKSLAADDTVGQPGRLDASPMPHYYDSEDTMSMGTRTPDGSTPVKYSIPPLDAGPGRVSNGGLNAVSHLVKEFEQRKQIFDDDAGFLVEVKSGQSASGMNPDGELRKLKLRFESWKKEYKVRLRETKVTLHRLGHSEAEKSRRKWWGKRSTRGP
ncbi:hypothetical protein HHK36_001968 [Tetracentron sinense]|uniref:Uncharacterized protein n=1 Tax=Tetracentron sinense TaxID=13715 RepID=A0A835DS24_TETSI|nr:hypothetical protein HHK36_001968 [Tetracentron sinense]